MSQAGLINIGTNPNSFKPNQVVNLVDDFVSNGNTTGLYNWGNGSLSYINGTATNPGQMTFPTISTGLFLLSTGGTVNPFLFGGGSFALNFVFNLVALSTNTNAYTFYLGFMQQADASVPQDPGNGVYFQYTHTVNSGNWQIVTNHAGTKTTQNTSTPAAIGFLNFGIDINAAGTSASFYINGTQIGTTISTNMPVVALQPAIISLVSAGNLPAQAVDLFYMQNILTTPR